MAATTLAKHQNSTAGRKLHTGGDSQSGNTQAQWRGTHTGHPNGTRPPDPAGAACQVLQPQFEREFSEHSYGFQPARNAWQAVQKAQSHLGEGRRWVVDLDLEKFFDRVNHDILMSRVARRVKDERILKLIRRYLEAGMMSEGIVSARTQGTPQGGPLSPLLSNILLTDLDQELERRGHRFCRYADDCNIYVKSEAEGQHAMAAITDYLERKLKLQVNRDKVPSRGLGNESFWVTASQFTSRHV